MKIIDLLNRIANGEEVPETIKYNGMEYYWKGIEKDYRNMKLDCLFEKLFTLPTNFLNEEVEIIEYKPFSTRVEEIYNRHIDYIYNKEDKKIEKLPMIDGTDNILLATNQTRRKINEIIDVINRGDK